MFLNAKDVLVDFPLSMRAHADSKTAGASPLGGRIHTERGRSYVRALEGISFQLGRGDRLALVGHNGSGKSTLLRVLAGIYHPTKGSVRASGNVSGIFNMSIGFRQEATGYRNLVLKGLMSGRSREQIDAALPEIAEFTGLGPYLDMPLHTYSQGMAMRLAFAATTSFTSDILVMDEWIGAGDAAFQEKLIGRMGDFIHASTIIVVASHSSPLLRRIANKAIWLEHGRVKMAGGIDVIDSYEASVLPQTLPAGLHPLVASRKGLWTVPAGTASLTSPHLLWNVAGGIDDLHLGVRRADGSLQIVRPAIERVGAWAFAHWVRPGMLFEVGNAQAREPIASFEIPAQA